MIAEGIWKSKGKKLREVHAWRPRRTHYGQFGRCRLPYYAMYIPSALRMGRGQEPAERAEARRDLIRMAALVFEDERGLVY